MTSSKLIKYGIINLLTCLSLCVTVPTFADASSAGASAKHKTAKQPVKKSSTQKRNRGCSGYAPPRYRKMVRNWQTVPKIPAPKFRDGYRELVLYAVNHGERIRIFPFLKDGTMDPEAMRAVQHLLRDKETDEEHTIHPRLVKLLCRISERFNARQINIISGYRASTEDKKEGKHKLGMAVDFMIPGSSLGAVAKQIRSFGHVGMGFYPISGFVHMDVRDTPSYFWLDRSGPGKRSCMRKIYAQTAAKSDQKWKPENDEPTLHKNKNGELLDDMKKPESPSATADSNTKSKVGLKKS